MRLLNIAVSKGDWRHTRWPVALDLAANRPVNWSPSVEEEETLGVLQRHGLIGILARAVPTPRLTALHRRYLARQEVMCRHAARLLQKLDEAAVPAALVKGPALATNVYRDPTIRLYTDIDLVVPPDSAEKALSVVAGDEAALPLAPKKPKADKREILLRDPSGVRFAVDLHWDLFSYSQLRGASVGAMVSAWARAIKEEDDQLGPLWRLPDDALLAFLSAHALLDHRFRLILFRDLAELAAGNPPWESLVGFAARHRLAAVTYLAHFIAAGAAAAAVPAEVLHELNPGSAAVRFLERRLPRTDLAAFDGRRPHSVNLAVTLLHDDPADRLALVLRAPGALPGWWRRTRRMGGTKP